MAYGYKILMNSLYGRFGINPKSTTTEVCSREIYDYLTHNKNFVTVNKLSDSYYIVSYIRNMGNVDPLEWNLPKVSAVQLSAAITACARIHMYKYISRPDCYYTDTDSAILGSPLPEEKISSIELGKLKIEHFVKKAIFLAPKSYILYTEEGSNIIKHKGAAKEHVDPEWFESQYADLSRTKHVKGVSTFKINWHNLHITKREYQVKLGIQLGTKRLPVFDNNNIWVDTQPKVVIDFGGQESSILKLMLKILQEQYDKIVKEYEERIDKKEKEYEERIASIRKEYDKKREEMILRFAKLPEEPVMSPLTESPTGLEQPIGTKKPKKQKKGTKKQKKGTKKQKKGTKKPKKPKKGTKKPKKGTKKPKGPNDTS
ncbi:uncharacterized protein LOC114256772 [Camellia sinensis]|uniref:uncharacterized protein LOC114256772 n=1 Tax=Camellia sinensis TaxID=4442 RepID=UPI0010363214|nr:uncharacterized protein LOC114256772 [Camellia sinensis]